MSTPTTLLPFQPALMSTAQLAAISLAWPATPSEPTICTNFNCVSGSPGAKATVWTAGRRAPRPCRAGHPQPGRAWLDGLIGGVDAGQRAWLTSTFAAHRRADPRRPALCACEAESAARTTPHAGPGPSSSCLVRAGATSPTIRVRSRRVGATGAGGLDGVAPGCADRPMRSPSRHKQPASHGTSARTRYATRRSPTHWMPGATPRRADPRPPRRPQNHRALRPRPRQPRPARCALPHRLRRRRLT